MRAVPALIAVATASIASCSDDAVPVVLGEEVWSGAQVEIWATDDAHICGGSFQALDSHAQHVSDYAAGFGIQSDAARYRYVWTSLEEFEGQGFCREDSIACLQSGIVYASHYSSHEIVHAEFATGHHSFVDEGLAVILGDASLENARDADPIPEVVDETQGRWLSNEHYGAAAKFLGAMEELHPEEYLPALLDTRRSDDFGSLSATVADGGVDADGVLAFNETEEECRIETFRLALSECGQDPSPWENENEWSVSGVLDCASEDVIGPSETGDIWAVRSFDIAERSTYRVTAVTEGFGSLVACDTPWCGSAFLGPLTPPGWMLLVSGVPKSVELAPGRYWIRVQQKLDDEPSPFSLSVVRLEGE